ncbi:RadC family protein [Streptococcus pluranimalium]|uniref:RadC family protein n=1 Tax=Streptococcus pluranimalium TaxID=82348 RepID=UPI001C4ACDEF|nr:DNA repair protein RadC [Streptococcus pluranimalium]MDY3041798.1 DNA repair protein RadC [Streptococcus pluranimalium]HEM6115544.1 DNA repair protein RadC [Streptococcus suis]
MYDITIPKEALLPRERLVQLGAEKLSNQELLAIVLRTGTKKEPVMALSQSILSELDSLAELHDLSLQELQEIHGIGQAKSTELKAMLELAKRIQASEKKRSERMTGSQQVARKMMIEIGREKQEHLVVLYLDTQNHIIEQRTIFIGTVRRSVAEPREILHYACKNMATSMILVHNHPSGTVEPSENDLRFTEKLKRCCDDMGMILLDHLIIGQKDYFSFREESDLL